MRPFTALPGEEQSQKKNNDQSIALNPKLSEDF
jgi:hypothetical protein